MEPGLESAAHMPERVIDIAGSGETTTGDVASQTSVAGPDHETSRDASGRRGRGRGTHGRSSRPHGERGRSRVPGRSRARRSRGGRGSGGGGGGGGGAAARSGVRGGEIVQGGWGGARRLRAGYGAKAVAYVFSSCVVISVLISLDLGWGAAFLAAILILSTFASLCALCTDYAHETMAEQHETLAQARLAMALHPVAIRLSFMDREFGSEDYEDLLQLDSLNGIVSRKGASPEFIARLPVHRFVPPSEKVDEVLGGGGGGGGPSAALPQNQDAITCSICLERYAEDDMVKTLPCLHMFHEGCVDRWLLISAHCPICMSWIGSQSTS